MKFGITGLEKTGKTTIFNLVTGMDQETSKFAASGESINRAMAKVPDQRLEKLAEIFSSKKIVHVSIDFLDFAGLNLGGDRENKFIGELRTLDAIVCVLRAFEDEEIPHPANSIDPLRDAENFLSELILNDLVVTENRIERLHSQIGKAKTDKLVKELALFERVKEILESDTPLREVEFDENDEFVLRGFGFLSMKPLLFALNIDENDAAELDQAVGKWKLDKLADKNMVAICPICAGIELEISRLEKDEAKDFLDDLGITDLGKERLMQTAYRLLGLITFFTGSEKDSHAWTVPAGSNAVKAAGAIHSDIARGFIRADVVAYEDLIAAGSVAEAKTQGKFHLEGKEYIVKDGDYILVRFNV